MKSRGLIVGLLRNKLWYYPIAIVVFILFVAYQTGRRQVAFSLACVQVQPSRKAVDSVA
jgi:uncharacterized membrane protein